MVGTFTFNSTKPIVTTYSADDIFLVGDESGGSYTLSFGTVGNLLSKPTPIGDVTPSTGAFTDLTATGDADLSGASSVSFASGTFSGALSGVTVNVTDTTGCYYELIGNICHFVYDITYDTLDTTDVSTIIIDALPFNMTDLLSCRFESFSSTGLNFAATDTLNYRGITGGNRIQFRDNADGLAYTYDSGKITASGRLYLTGSYIVT